MKNKSSNFLLIGVAVVIAILLLLAYYHKKAHAPKVYFGNLKDGSQVESPFKVEMKAENLVVEPATKGVAEGHGHFHIIIDSPLPSVGEPVPMDSLHLHYGKGQTNAMVDLPAGEHMLTLQFANGNHFPFDPQITEVVHIRVTKQNRPPIVADSTKQQVEAETATTTKTVTTTYHTEGPHTVKKETVKPNALPETPPPINPGNGSMGGGE